MAFEELNELAMEAMPLNGSFLELPPEIISRIGGLITILKAAGIIFIGYLVFLLVKWIFNIKRYRKIRRIDRKIGEIDKKLDLLLAKKGIKFESENEKQKKAKKKSKSKKKTSKK